MNTSCKNCGTPASEDQAFCAKCGAVIGMKGAAPKKADPNLARTIAVRDFKLPALPKKEPPASSKPAGTARPANQAKEPVSYGQAGKESERSNTALLVLIGFLGVLIVGGLLLLLLYFFL